MNSNKMENGGIIWSIYQFMERFLTELLSREFGLTQKTAWHLAHRIRKSIEQNTSYYIYSTIGKCLPYKELVQ